MYLSMFESVEKTVAQGLIIDPDSLGVNMLLSRKCPCEKVFLVEPCRSKLSLIVLSSLGVMLTGLLKFPDPYDPNLEEKEIAEWRASASL